MLPAMCLLRWRSWLGVLRKCFLTARLRAEGSEKPTLAALCGVLKVEVNDFRQRRRHSPLRAIAAKCLVRYAGQNQREVARLLNAGSGSAISKHLRHLRDALAKDKKLARLVRKAEKQLDTEWASAYEKQ